MNNKTTILPIGLFAYSNPKNDLDRLIFEQKAIRKIFEKAEKVGICDPIERPAVDFSTLINTFQNSRYSERICIFHYGGHAGDYELLLTDSKINAKPFNNFLSKIYSLKLVFLNGCSTKDQAEDLKQLKIPAIIATSQDVPDDSGNFFSEIFYYGLVEGFTIRQSFNQAKDATCSKFDNCFEIKQTLSDPRKPKPIPKFLWNLYLDNEDDGEWKIEKELNNPYFGLPKPPKYYFPQTPYISLRPYSENESLIFWGRGREIRDLFIRVMDPDTNPIVLFYGQTGVGKSSLLYAGLIPRLKFICNVFHSRRIPNLGLTATLLKMLDVNSVAPNDFILKLKDMESSTSKPILIIIDQLEEAFTKPLKKLSNEFVDFIDFIKSLFNQRFINVKMVLGYRKEYHAEVDAECRRQNIPFLPYFLESLKRENIIEIVNGSNLNITTKNQYNIEIEKNLDDQIAHDLSTDTNSPIAPILQIMLTKMWEKSYIENIPKRFFSKLLYSELKNQGTALSDFINEKIKEIEKSEKNVVESGLLLDILNFHTTTFGTAATNDLKSVQKRYEDSSLINSVILKCKDLYLLSEANNSKGQISLAHDTLAPIIRDMYTKSTLPGQRAARLLESKEQDTEDIKHNKKTVDDVEFSKADLAIIDAGRIGMRKWNLVEKEVIENSYKNILEYEKTIQEQKEEIQQRLEESLKANSYSIINFLRLAEQLEDYEKAFRFSELAYEVSENVVSRSSLIKSFSKLAGNYNITIPELSQYSGFRSMNITMDGLLILGTLMPGILIKVNFEHKKIVESYPCSDRKINTIKFSSNYDFAITASDDRLVIWDKEFNEVRSANSYIFKLGDINSAEFSFDFSIIVIAFDAGRVLITDEYFNIIKEIFVSNHLVNSVALSPNGNFIICTTNEAKLYLFNSNGEKLSEYKSEEGPIKKCSFSPDGKMIVTASEDGTARFFNFTNDKSLENAIVFDGQIGQVNTAEFSPDSTMIVTCARSVTKVWDCITGECIVSIDNNECATVARFSNDSTGIYVIGSGMSYYYVRAVDIHKKVKSIDVPLLSSADLNDIGIDNIDNSRPGFNRLEYLMESNNAEMIKSFADYYKELGEKEFTKRKLHYKRFLVLFNYMQSSNIDYEIEDYELEWINEIVRKST